ncbi:hypothetical protein MKX01_041489 [Papaver californicum]|nr:hypothetical protein MKX01_041489 [Papaver californicum]
MELHIECQWRPQKYDNCISFGHSSKNCTRKNKSKWVPRKGQWNTLTSATIKEKNNESDNIDKPPNDNEVNEISGSIKTILSNDGGHIGISKGDVFSSRSGTLECGCFNYFSSCE